MTCHKGFQLPPLPKPQPPLAPLSPRPVRPHVLRWPPLGLLFPRPGLPPTAPAPPQPRAKARAPPAEKSPSSSSNPDIPRYDANTRTFYRDPCAYRDKFPDSWEDNAFRGGKYPDPTTFISGLLAPDYHKH